MQPEPVAKADPGDASQEARGNLGITILARDADVTKGLAIILSILENYKEPQDHSYELSPFQVTSFHVQRKSPAVVSGVRWQRDLLRRHTGSSRCESSRGSHICF